MPEETDEQPSTPESPARPADLPDKFWDADGGAIRTDALVKSYNELERRMGELPATAPDSPDAYEIIAPEGYEDLLGSDSDVNARLHAARFTQQQAALVYELAAERLIPLAEHLVAENRADGEADALTRHFGNKDAWEKLQPQIASWGRSNLGDAAFDAMSKTAEGVIAMHRMMKSAEPAILQSGHHTTPVLSEAELRRKMEDPRYWRDEDPAYVNEIHRGFEALYPY